MIFSLVPGLKIVIELEWKPQTATFSCAVLVTIVTLTISYATLSQNNTLHCHHYARVIQLKRLVPIWFEVSGCAHSHWLFSIRFDDWSKHVFVRDRWMGCFNSNVTIPLDREVLLSKWCSNNILAYNGEVCLDVEESRSFFVWSLWWPKHSNRVWLAEWDICHVICNIMAVYFQVQIQNLRVCLVLFLFFIFIFRKLFSF